MSPASGGTVGSGVVGVVALLSPPHATRSTVAASTVPTPRRMRLPIHLSLPGMAAAEVETITYPGAHRPDRYRRVDAHGVGIAVYEWGDESAPPLFCAHGGLDFAATFDLMAPIIADGGWRVISWDQ